MIREIVQYTEQRNRQMRRDIDGSYDNEYNETFDQFVDRVTEGVNQRLQEGYKFAGINYIIMGYDNLAIVTLKKPED